MRKQAEGNMEVLFDKEDMLELAKQVKPGDDIWEGHLFTADFISATTRFTHLSELIDAFIEFKVPYPMRDYFEEDSRIDRILEVYGEDDVLDEFIAQHTIFESWYEFQRAGSEFYFAKSLCAKVIHNFSGIDCYSNTINCSFKVDFPYTPISELEADAHRKWRSNSASLIRRNSSVAFQSCI